MVGETRACPLGQDSDTKYVPLVLLVLAVLNGNEYRYDSNIETSFLYLFLPLLDQLFPSIPGGGRVEVHSQTLYYLSPKQWLEREEDRSGAFGSHGRPSWPSFHLWDLALWTAGLLTQAVWKRKCVTFLVGRLRPVGYNSGPRHWVSASSILPTNWSFI